MRPTQQHILSSLRTHHLLTVTVYFSCNCEAGNMPRKCCTMFDGKPCKSNYDSTEEKVTVYSFPKEASEQERWVPNLPNKLTCNISKNIGVCAKHWPVDCAKVKVRGGH